MKIVTIKEDSPHLQNVLELWRRNRETLGFLPTEAFVKGAREETLLVSESPSGDFQGYLLFRKSLTKATIVHLCVQENYRLLGIGRSMVEKLKEKTSDLARIVARCPSRLPSERCVATVWFISCNRARRKRKCQKGNNSVVL